MLKPSFDVVRLLVAIAAIVTCTNAYEDGDVRLDTGQDMISPYDGVVQVYSHGSWGGLCANNFAITEATVVCRALGHKLATRMANAQDMFPENNNTVVTVSRLVCTGREYFLRQCPTVEYQVPGASLSVCSGKDVAAVVCSPIDDYAVRLMGGSNRFEGRVEVYHRRNSAGLWGTICNDYWGYADAKVICRQLKYGNPDKAQESNGDYYKGGSAGMEVLLDNVGCDGDEATLASCYTLGWDIENCHRNTELAAVVCEPAIQQGYLTVGAIAGIVTGSVLFIVFVMMLIAVCCRHIKNKKRLRTDPINHGPIVTYISHGAAAPGVNLPPGNQFVNMQYNVATVPRPPTYSVVGPAGSAVDYQQPPTPGSTLAGTGGT